MSFRRPVINVAAVSSCMALNNNSIRISCYFLVAKMNPSTAYAVPLPLGKGGIKKPAWQKQKHTVIFLLQGALKTNTCGKVHRTLGNPYMF